MQCERKIQDKQNKFWKLSHASRSFGHSYIQFIQDYIYCPWHEVTMGFQQFYPERVIQLSRPDGRSYWTFTKTRLELSRIATWFPTLRCKTEVSRAMEPLGQNRSRTSLQDRDPACKRNLWDALRCKIGIPRANFLNRTYDTLGRALVRFWRRILLADVSDTLVRALACSST